MVKNNMDFSLVEVELKRWSQVTVEQRRVGRYVTKHYLMTQAGWTKSGPQHLSKLFVWYTHWQCFALEKPMLSKAYGGPCI